jgi:citrate synthase
MTSASTQIGTPTSQTHVLKMRGKDTLADIVGERTFSETFFFIVTGRFASTGELRVFDACLTALMDHGLTPTAVVARLVEDSMPDDVQVSIAAGLLMVGNKFVGPMAGTGRLLREGVASGRDLRQWAAEAVARARTSARRIPGFGHPYYSPKDPRAERLFAIAREAGVAGRHTECLHILSEEMDKAAGKHLTLNTVGAIGAILCDLGFPVEAMRAVAVVSRAAGLAAHVLEEKQRPITPTIVETANAIPYRDPD